MRKYHFDKLVKSIIPDTNAFKRNTVFKEPHNWSKLKMMSEAKLAITVEVDRYFLAFMGIGFILILFKFSKNIPIYTDDIDASIG